MNGFARAQNHHAYSARPPPKQQLRHELVTSPPRRADRRGVLSPTLATVPSSGGPYARARTAVVPGPSRPWTLRPSRAPSSRRRAAPPCSD